jgi:hypothetical protein
MLKPLHTVALALAVLIISSTQAPVNANAYPDAGCDSNGNCQGQNQENGQSDNSDNDSDADTTKYPPKPPQPRVRYGFTLDPATPRDADICLPNTTACLYIDWANTKKKPTKKQKTNIENQLRQVATKLKLPDPTPRFGPDPSVNEWKMLAVGFPIWLWTDNPKSVTSTTTHDGLTFTLKATWTSTTFTMGDGHTKTCTNTTTYPAHIDKPGSPSPTCGYTYQTKSPKNHPYTVTAATHWRIDWTTNGQTGTFNHTNTGTKTLNIGELASMIKR